MLRDKLRYYQKLTPAFETNVLEGRRRRSTLQAKSVPQSPTAFGLEDLFLRRDDDARRHHNHDVPGVATNPDVLKQPAQVRNLAQERRAELIAAFAQRL